MILTTDSTATNGINKKRLLHEGFQRYVAFDPVDLALSSFERRYLPGHGEWYGGVLGLNEFVCNRRKHQMTLHDAECFYGPEHPFVSTYCSKESGTQNNTEPGFCFKVSPTSGVKM